MFLTSTAISRDSPPLILPVILSSNLALGRLHSARLMVPTNPSQFARLRSSFSRPTSLISSDSRLHEGLAGSLLRFKDLGTDGIRVFSGIDGGSGGIGGMGGRGGGGGEDLGGDGDFNSNRSLLSWYLDLLAKFPVMTKAVTSALLNMIGDIVCQVFVDKVASLDYKRTFMFTFLGMVLVGPTLHFWYLYLSKVVTVPGASGAFLRLVLDQAFFSPAFIGVFLCALMSLEGRASEVLPRLKQEWFSSVVANWQLWIPFQFFNFRFVPQQFQVLSANVLSLLWNVILSYKAHKVVIQN